MIRFNNDYNCGAHPRVMDALAAAAEETHGGYGLDTWCERAAAMVRKLSQAPDAAVHFLVGGTQANFTVIGAALRSYQGVISADTGHISVHETGAVEHGGHKVHALPSVDGKITAEQVDAEARAWEESPVPEHVTQPKMVYLSYPTEYGTLYSKAELQAIASTCRAHGLYLFVDGARLGYGLGAPEADVTLPDLAQLADAFTIGGTKCGLLFGEAVVLMNPALHEGFRSCMKQNGGMLAKGWLLGLQFAAILDDGLYFGIAREAVAQAMRIRRAFEQAGVSAYVESPTNQQFVVLPDAACDRLAERFAFDPEGRTSDGRRIVRFCTSWSTRAEDVDALIAAIAQLAGEGVLG